MSLRDELVENERAASDPLVRVIFRAKCSLGKNRENHQNVSDFAPENDANQRVGRRALVLDEFVAQRHGPPE